MKKGFYIGYSDDEITVCNKELKWDKNKYEFKIPQTGRWREFCSALLKVLNIKMDDMELKFINLAKMRYKIVNGKGKKMVSPVIVGDTRIKSDDTLKPRKGLRLYVARHNERYGIGRYEMPLAHGDDPAGGYEFFDKEEEYVNVKEFESVFSLSIPDGYQIVIHLPSLELIDVKSYWPFVHIGYKINVTKVEVLRGVPTVLKTRAHLSCEFTSGRKFYELEFTKDGLTAFHDYKMKMEEVQAINFYIGHHCNAFTELTNKIKTITFQHIQKGPINANNQSS